MNSYSLSMDPIMPRRLFLTLVLSLFAVSRVTADEPVKLPEPSKVHLYLLIGQSNMAGRGKVEPSDKVPHPRVFMFTKEQTWAPAVDPLHFDKPNIAGVGLGSSFGRAMADAHPDVVIGLIPCAVGGTPLQRWQKGGDLYAQALVRLKAALPSGTLKGILWHQGEGDSGSEATATSYATRLSQMVRDLRTEVGNDSIPFVAGELGHFLKKERTDGKPSFWPVVNEQINSLPKLLSHSATVSAADLKANPDQVHFDAASLREFGKRYAAAMQKLQSP